MKLVAAFLAGAVFASLVSMVWNSTRESSSASADPEPTRATDKLVASLRPDVLTALPDSRSGAEGAGESELSKSRLKTSLWDMTASGKLKHILDGMTASDAAIVDEKLHAFRDRIRAHEQSEIELLSRDESKVMLTIPAFSEDGSELADLREELDPVLGNELAGRFLGAVSEHMWFRLRQWGRAHQTITVHLTEPPYHLNYESVVHDAQTGEASTVRYLTRPDPEYEDLSWLDPFLENRAN